MVQIMVSLELPLGLWPGLGQKFATRTHDIGIVQYMLQILEIGRRTQQ